MKMKIFNFLLLLILLNWNLNASFIIGLLEKASNFIWLIFSSKNILTTKKNQQMLKFLKKNNEEQTGSTKEGKAASGNCKLKNIFKFVYLKKSFLKFNLKLTKKNFFYISTFSFFQKTNVLCCYFLLLL